jgi:hypothetical protein
MIDLPETYAPDAFIWPAVAAAFPLSTVQLFTNVSRPGVRVRLSFSTPILIMLDP